MTSLSVIVPSCGRPSLMDTLATIVPQLRAGDQLIVDVNDGAWGHAARRRQMPRATGDAIIFMDDDDVYTPGSFAVIRDGFATDPERLHLFRMAYPDGHTIWTDPEVRDGNVSTQMICVPNRDHGGVWGDRYAGDLDFVESAVRTLGPPVWHEEIIARVGRNI